MSVNSRVVFCVVCALALGGCNRELPLPVVDTTYYPIVAGTYRTFFIHDTTYITSSGPEGVQAVDSTYFRRELTTGDTVLDLQGRTVWWLELYTALPDSVTGQPSEFTFQELWTQWNDGRFAERIEGNIRYQVLAFPADVNRAWNGNEWNNLLNPQGADGINLQYDRTSFYYLSTDSTITLPNDQRYEHCYVVQWRKSDVNSILYDAITWEVYAPGIGLVYRYDRYKYRNKTDASQTNTLSTSSYVREQYLIDHNF
jgi:hypothetical protein